MAARQNKAERQQRMRVKPDAETTVPKRLAAAKREYSALQEWKQSGEGERPATPNFNSFPAGSKERKDITGTSTGRPSALGPRGLLGQAASKKAGRRRGTGNQRLSDDDLVQYCARVQRQHKSSTAVDEFYYARWVEKIAGGRRRFMAAWDEAAGGPKMVRTERAPRKATTKAPAKKAAAKKQPAKKAAPAKRQVAAFRKTTGRKRTPAKSARARKR